jgi:hypothetical protein
MVCLRNIGVDTLHKGNTEDNNNNNNNKVSSLCAQKFNRLMTSYIDSTGTYTEARDEQNQNRNKPWP